MRWWLDFVAIRWLGFVDILALLLGRGLQSLILFLFGWSVGNYLVLRMVGAAPTDPVLAKAIGSIPPLVLQLTPWAVGATTGSVPWLLLAMFVWRRNHAAGPKINPRSN